MIKLIAIDPGKGGAIVTGDSDYGALKFYKMPQDAAGLFNLLTKLQLFSSNVIIEDVGKSRPGNAARSMYTFAVHRGHLEMAMYALGYNVTWVRPTQWMDDLFTRDGYPHGSKPAQVAERKKFIQGHVTAYLGTDVPKYQADAAAILIWGLKKHAGQ